MTGQVKRLVRDAAGERLEFAALVGLLAASALSVGLVRFLRWLDS